MIATLFGVFAAVHSLGVLVSLPLATVVQYCAPQIAPQTAMAIIKVESGGHPWAIDDDTDRRSYFPDTREDAANVAMTLLDQGHVIDVGLMQVDSVHFHADRDTVYRVFDPCVNVRMGGTILLAAYERAELKYGPGRVALYHAFEGYNPGDATYAKRVWDAGLTL